MTDGRRKTALLVALLTALSLGLATPPVAADDQTVQKELAAQYTKIEQAFQKKDIQPLQAILASDFSAVIKNPKTKRGTKITRDQMLQGWQRWFAVLQSISSQSHIITKLKVRGNKATAIVQYVMVFTEDHGREGSRKAAIRGPNRDTWIQSAGGWKWLRAEDLGSTTKSEFQGQKGSTSEGNTEK